MLSTPRSRLVLGIALLAIGTAGLGIFGARAVVMKTHRHVVVEIFNVNSIVQVFVNCEQAVALGRQRRGTTRDLGWLDSDDRIYLSATSRDGSPSWGFRVTSNGEPLFHGRRGHAGVLGFPAEPNTVVLAKAFTADSDYLGPIGCQPPSIASVAGYTQSPDDAHVPEASGITPAFRPLTTPYDQIDDAGGWALSVLAVLGVTAALGIEAFRSLAWSHRKLAAGVLGFLVAVASLFFGVLGLESLFAILTVSGTVLLFAVAITLTVPPCRRRLEGAGAT